MTDKLQKAREYILNRIESGEFRGGEKLPGALELAERSQISFTIMQTAFSTLVADGILVSISRQGTYVRSDWAERILPDSFRIFRTSWKELVEQYVRPQIPRLRIGEKFLYGAYEIRVTSDVLFYQNDYLDLTEFLDAEYPERDDFFNARIEQFRSRSGKLFALPLIFSPWVIGYNEEMIRQVGGTPPQANWSWDDFLALIRVLRQSLPPEKVLIHFGSPSQWPNFFVRGGGSFLSSEQGDCEAQLGSPRSIAALARLQELRRALNPVPGANGAGTGESALRLCTKQDICHYRLKNYQYLPMPQIPGGSDCTMMSGDLLCVRRTVNNFQAVRSLIRLLLSPEIQEELGRRRYGIPIRKSAAIRTFDENDPTDRMFFSEMTKITVDPYSAWPAINEIVQNAILRFLQENRLPAELATELVPALNAIVKYTS